LAHHRPDRALLAELCVYGCTGGDFLVGAKPGGQLTACSFAAPPPVGPEAARPRVTDLARYWPAPRAFCAIPNCGAPPRPCASCDYHALCRGGCKVVSGHATGDPSAPDPECPRVIDARGARVHLPVV